MRTRKWLRLVSLFMVVLMAQVLFTGCYGKFALHKKVERWNGEISDKWARSLVCALFNIFPVYGIAWLLDWVVFNTIEFYSGKNPVLASNETTPLVKVNGDKEARLYLSSAGPKLELYNKGVLQQTLILKPMDNGQAKVVVLGPQGESTHTVTVRPSPTGNFLVSDQILGEATKVSIVSPEALAAQMAQ